MPNQLESSKAVRQLGLSSRPDLPALNAAHFWIAAHQVQAPAAHSLACDQAAKAVDYSTIIQELRDVVEGPLAAVLLWHLQASFPDCWEEVCTLVLPHAS